MDLEQWQRSKRIKAEAEEAAKRTVERVLSLVKQPALIEFDKGVLVEYSVTKTTGEFMGYVESPAEHCLVDFGLCDLALLDVQKVRKV